VRLSPEARLAASEEATRYVRDRSCSRRDEL
jgi:hypothetical protein